MKRLRLISDGNGRTKIFDAETGEAILHARRVTFEHDARKVPVITMELLCVDGIEMDIQADATVQKIELPRKGSNTVSSVFKHNRPPELKARS